MVDKFQSMKKNKLVGLLTVTKSEGLLIDLLTYPKSTYVMAINMMEIDAHEGISAFLDKRTPSWDEN